MLQSIVILILLTLCIGTGAWLFFIWSVKRGDYDDIEGPKYRMLDDEDPEQNTHGEKHDL
jgi:cbb3-type cytochrome oxidase maturation protein